MGPILVAGARGFIGTAVTTELARRGSRVRALGRSREAIARTFRGLRVEAVSADVTRPETLDGAVAGCSAIVGCVQFDNYPFENPRRSLTFDFVDHRGTRNLLAAAARAGIRRYVYLSGVGASAQAPEPWRRAKGEAEGAIERSGLGYTIFRPSWVYGPGDRSLNRLADLVRYLPLVPVIGDGRQRIQPVFIDDLAAAIVESIERTECEGRVLEIGGPSVLAMDEILIALMDVLGKRRRLIHVPPWVARLAALFLERLPRPPLTRGGVAFVTMEGLADNRDLLSLFPGLSLTRLDQGLASYLRA